MEPVAALERIAYLLERAQAPTYKVRAFRGAAATLAGLGADELEAIWRAGTLRNLPGIGPSTAAVIEQALAGETPVYLADLETDEPAPPDPAAAELRAALRGDCHGHSDWSDGGSSIEAMARAALDLGHDYWTLTDHSARLTVAHGLDAERLGEQLEVVASLNAELAGESGDFRLLTGMEVDILEDGALDMDDELLSRLDVVVASVHSKLRMERAPMTRRMVKAIESPQVDILGHCTGRIRAGRGRPPSTFDAASVFNACSDTGTAVEINCRPERLDPPMQLLELAYETGCSVSISTDAHAPGQLEWQPNGCERAARIGVEPARVVNSWSVEHLLEWTGSH